MDPDDKYDETVSNYSGFFQLEGWENEILDIDPYMKVIHTCMADKARRPVGIVIPKKQGDLVYEDVHNGHPLGGRPSGQNNQEQVQIQHDRAGRRETGRDGRVLLGDEGNKLFWERMLERTRK